MCNGPELLLPARACVVIVQICSLGSEPLTLCMLSSPTALSNSAWTASAETQVYWMLLTAAFLLYTQSFCSNRNITV